MPNEQENAAGRAALLAATTSLLNVGPDEAEAKARNRNWLDTDGRVTPEGQTMVAAIGGQTGTRSVFR